MRPDEKGWLAAYLDYRKDLLKDLTLKKRSSHPEHSLYAIIQPTGLMYGHSVGNIHHPDAEQWSEKSKMKVLLAESLLSSSLLFYDKPVKTQEELERVFEKTIEHIVNFYNNIFPELAIPSKTLFGKRKSALEVAEKILEKRVDRTVDFQGNFWMYFFHNSLLFLDVFIFGQWIHTNADRIVADFFRYERNELRFSIVKVIAAAAHSDNVVDFEERKLLELFIQSADLSSEKRKEAITIFEKGVDIEAINLPSENSWILKKFFLEIAILTMWADKKVEQAEQEFLKQFCAYLDFSDEDLDNSLIAIEGFVLEHWGQLDYLQDKQDYNRVSEHFISRVSKIAEKNKTRLLKEVHDKPTTQALLKKARTEELTPTETERIHHDLVAILQGIPAFAIISLPQRFLTLPVLMKILPKNFFTDEL
jgi:tellurite resistance protein